MNLTVRVLRRAEADLTEIHRYVTRDDPGNAHQILDDLLDTIERLGRLPTMAPLARDRRLKALGYRVLVRGRYLIFYKVVGRHLRVYRVLHHRREYARLI